MSDKSIAKAKQYLTGGKVKVLALSGDAAVIEVHGSGTRPYKVTFTPRGWECDCPAYIECAHLIAAKLITDLRPAEHWNIGEQDRELSAFIDSIVATRDSEQEYGNTDN